MQDNNINKRICCAIILVHGALARSHIISGFRKTIVIVSILSFYKCYLRQSIWILVVAKLFNKFNLDIPLYIYDFLLPIFFFVKNKNIYMIPLS